MRVIVNVLVKLETPTADTNHEHDHGSIGGKRFRAD